MKLALKREFERANVGTEKCIVDVLEATSVSGRRIFIWRARGLGEKVGGYDVEQTYACRTVPCDKLTHPTALRIRDSP